MYPDDPEYVEAHIKDFDERNGRSFGFVNSPLEES
jgi:hypothetical protein